MHSRLRLPVIAIALAFICSGFTISRAQETAPTGTSLLDELRALRQLVEQQSKQIQTLSDQVARLTARIDNGVAAGTPIAAAPPATVAAETPATPRVVAPPQPPVNSHIVVKGDSLDKIAKQHNTTVADLLKLNKIPDPKKIQIGQQIILPPATATPAVDKPSEKKE